MKAGIVALIIAVARMVVAGAEDNFYYSFTESVGTASAGRVVGVSFQLAEEEVGNFSAEYSRNETVADTREDTKTISFERKATVPRADGIAFFKSLMSAGVLKLPKSDGYIGDPPNQQINATFSGQNYDVRFISNSRPGRGPRKAIHDAALAFAAKLAIDRPENLEQATHLIEGDNTPARPVPFFSLVMNPDRYNGKRISVIAYYHGEFEFSVVVPGRFDWRTHNLDESFWLVAYRGS